MVTTAILTKQEAIDKGEKFYFTGNPCKRGHIAKRRVSNYMCMQCTTDVYQHADRINYRDPENTLRRQLYQREIISRKTGMPFSITFDEIDKPEFCPVLGVRLNYGCSTEIGGKQTRDPNKASIDKVIPELGYVPGNVRIISFRANNLKSNATPEELEKILDYIKRNKQNG